MLMADIALAVLIFGPFVITYFLKSNAALGFLALSVGFVLSTSVIGDLTHLLSEMNLSVTNDTIGLILLLLPLIITLLLTRHGSGHRNPVFIMQLVAALATGGLLALSAGPLLASSSFNPTTSGLWAKLSNIQASVIGAGALISLGLVWLSGHHKKH